MQFPSNQGFSYYLILNTSISSRGLVLWISHTVICESHLRVTSHKINRSHAVNWIIIIMLYYRHSSYLMASVPTGDDSLVINYWQVWSLKARKEPCLSLVTLMSQHKTIIIHQPFNSDQPFHLHVWHLAWKSSFTSTQEKLQERDVDQSIDFSLWK